MKQFKITIFFLFTLCISACQQTGSQGNAIVFGDVIGTYSGVCGTYVDDPNSLSDTELTDLTFTAIDQNSARIKSSSPRIAEQIVQLQSSTAAEITFKSTISTVESIDIKYMADTDSIVVMHEGWDGEINLLFGGARL